MTDSKTAPGNLMEMYTIYEKPLDYPDKFVVRKWLIGKGIFGATEQFWLADTLEAARECVPRGLFRNPRFDGDDPVHRGVELLLTDPPAGDAEEVLEASVAKLRRHRVGGLRERYVVAEQADAEPDDLAGVDFAALEARVLALIDSGGLTHDHPDFRLYQRLQARFRGKGNAEFVEVRTVFTAERPLSPDEAEETGRTAELNEPGVDPNGEGS